MDEKGNPVRGPIGVYGGPRVLPIGLVAAAVVLLIGLVLTTPFRFGDADPDAGPRPTLSAAPPGIGGDLPVQDGNVTPTPTSSPLPTGIPTDAPTGFPTDSPGATPTPGLPAQTPLPTLSPGQTPVVDPKATPIQVTTGVVYHSCEEVRKAGKAPLYRGQPGYSAELDRNGDGIACLRGNS